MQDVYTGRNTQEAALFGGVLDSHLLHIAWVNKSSGWTAGRRGGWMPDAAPLLAHKGSGWTHIRVIAMFP